MTLIWNFKIFINFPFFRSCFQYGFRLVWSLNLKSLKFCFNFLIWYSIRLNRIVVWRLYGQNKTAPSMWAIAKRRNKKWLIKLNLENALVISNDHFFCYLFLTHLLIFNTHIHYKSISHVYSIIRGGARCYFRYAHCAFSCYVHWSKPKDDKKM